MTQHVFDLCEIIKSDEPWVGQNSSVTKDQAAIHLKNYLHLALAPISKGCSGDGSKMQAGTQTIFYQEIIESADTICQLIMKTSLTSVRKKNVQISLEIVLFSA